MFTFAEMLVIVCFSMATSSVFTFAYIINGTKPKRKRRAFDYAKDK